jgi:hypothetical protein
VLFDIILSRNYNDKLSIKVIDKHFEIKKSKIIKEKIEKFIINKKKI